MEDQHAVKTKGQYNHWFEPENKLLLRLLVEGINQGFRDASGKFNKLIVESRILKPLNQKLGSTKTYTQYRKRTKILKTRHQSLADFLRCNSGFGWDSEMKKFTADDEVWKVYLETHPNNKHLRDESFEDLEDLRIIYGPNTATGQNAMGLGITVNTITSQVLENEAANISFVQMMEDTQEMAHELESENLLRTSSGKNKGEKLQPRKKARTDAYHSNKISEELNTMTEVSSQIFGMIQKRWEKEAQEKEVEDKANNVWDAIKEIPDLDDNLRYEAMTLIHSLGMKLGFVNMSITDRSGWIKQNLRKPSE